MRARRIFNREFKLGVVRHLESALGRAHLEIDFFAVGSWKKDSPPLRK